MASERDLQALEENDDELLALQTRMRVEGYRYEPRRTQSPVLSDDSSTDGSDSDDSDVEHGNKGDNNDFCRDWGIPIGIIFFKIMFTGPYADF